MARKQIDRVRARSALEVITEHPVLVLFEVSPLLVALGIVWWLAGAGWAIAGAVVLLVTGAAIVVVKR